MRTRRISNRVFFALALALHLIVVGSAYFRHANAPATPAPPVAVRVIIPAAPAAMPPTPPAPAPIQSSKPPKAKPTPPNKPKPAPKMAATPKSEKAGPPTLPDAVSTPAAAPEPVQEPTPAPAPAAPPVPVAQAPVKTGVSVNATYVATQTEKWYPSLSKRYGEQGTVVVRVHVSADGRAEKVELKKRSDYPLLDTAAIGLAKSLKYNPASIDGNPVADWVEIPITFRLRTP